MPEGEGQSHLLSLPFQFSDPPVIVRRFAVDRVKPPTFAVAHVELPERTPARTPWPWPAWPVSWPLAPVPAWTAFLTVPPLSAPASREIADRPARANGKEGERCP